MDEDADVLALLLERTQESVAHQAILFAILSYLEHENGAASQTIAAIALQILEGSSDPGAEPIRAKVEGICDAAQAFVANGFD